MSVLFRKGENRAVKLLLNREDVDITWSDAGSACLFHRCGDGGAGIEQKEASHDHTSGRSSRRKRQYHLEVLNVLLSKSDSPAFDRR
jgi:hypothetical protein